MFNPQDVFPDPNVDPATRPWARKVTNSVRDLGYEMQNVKLAQNGDNRALGGQLAVVGRQLNDLQARSTHTTLPANLQLILGSSMGEVGPAARTIPLPAPSGTYGRSAIIVGSGSAAWTGTSTGSGIADSAFVGLEFRQDSRRLWFNGINVGSSRFFSFQGDDTFNLVVPVTVPVTGSVFDLRMWVGASAAGGQVNRGARLENMFFTIIYGDRI